MGLLFIVTRFLDDSRRQYEKQIPQHTLLISDKENGFLFALSDIFGLIFNLPLLVGFVKIVSEASNEENSPCQ